VLARVDRCGSRRIDLGCRVRGGHEHQDGPICGCAGQGTSPVTLLQGVNREFFVPLPTPVAASSWAASTARPDSRLAAGSAGFSEPQALACLDHVC
jgi:hypothetical protein